MTRSRALSRAPSRSPRRQRYILEDGKLNVCLRMLVDFTNFQRSSRSLTADQQEKMDAFEKGLGQVLRNTWKHVEALQTTDLPLLLEHITEVLKAVRATRPAAPRRDRDALPPTASRARAVPASCVCVTPRTRAWPPPLALAQGSAQPNEKLEKSLKAGDVSQRQEVLVIHYLNDMLEHAQKELDESRFMPQIMDLGLFKVLVRFMSVHVRTGVLQDHHLVVGFSVRARARTEPSLSLPQPAAPCERARAHRISRATAATRRPRPARDPRARAGALDAERDRGLPNVRGPLHRRRLRMRLGRARGEGARLQVRRPDAEQGRAHLSNHPGPRLLLQVIAARAERRAPSVARHCEV